MDDRMSPDVSPEERRAEINCVVGKAVRKMAENRQQMRPVPWRGIIVGVLVAIGGSLAGWVGRTTWTGITTQITADSAKISDVAQLKFDNATEHTALRVDINAVRDVVENQGDLLNALYQVQVDGVKPAAAKAKVAKQQAARKAAQP